MKRVKRVPGLAANWINALRQLIIWPHSIFRLKTQREAIEIGFDAYCPDCGGSSLKRNVRTDFVFCPKCSRK